MLWINQPQFAFVIKCSFVEKTVCGNYRLSEKNIFQFDLTPTLHTPFHPIGGSPPIRDDSVIYFR